MKSFNLRLTCLAALALILSGCGGYYFPHVYSGPAKSIYLKTWRNQTNQLELGNDVFQALNNWFRKSRTITITKEKTGADLLLAGEIKAIDLPSVSFGEDTSAKEVKVILKVRYILKDMATGDILWEVSKEKRSEEYSVADTAAGTRDNEQQALEKIIDELAENIYINTLDKLRRQNLK